MPSKKQKRRVIKKQKPSLPWQVAEYAAAQQYNFHLPYTFILLCRLWQVSPQTVLLDFMDNISFGSWKREGREVAKEHLAQYIIAMGYGQQYYSPQDIQTMCKQLDAAGMLFPQATDMELLDAYVAWRDKFHTAWFNEWFHKVRRNINDTAANNI